MAHQPLSLSAVQKATTEALHDFVGVKIKQAETIHPLYSRLWRAIDDQLGAGGKRLRPYIVMLSYQSFGGRRHSAALQVASAWELLHVGLLMHDDIIDRDDVRHGKPNVTGLYKVHYAGIKDKTNRVHYADAAALLAGDLLLSAAHDFIVTSSFSDSIRKRVAELLEEACFTVIGGELLDSEAAAPGERIDPKIIAETKTASYSLIGPLLSGACLAGADHRSQLLLRKLGTTLGVGYQLVDDMLGVFGVEELTGKSATSDLSEGKRSLVVTMGLALMSPDDRDRAEQMLEKHDKTEVRKLRALLEATSLKENVATELMNYKQTALKIIGQLSLPDYYEQAFHELVDVLLDRQF